MTAPTESKLYLELCQAVAQARTAFGTRHRNSITLPEDEIQKRAGGNKPLLDIEKLNFEETLLNEFFGDLLPLLQKHEIFERGEIERFVSVKDKKKLAEVMQPVLIGDLKDLKSLSARFEVGTDFLLFIGLGLSQALLELFAHALVSRIDQEDWLQGNCPVCGGHPAIGRLRREDGKRIMRCSLCGTEWTFKRIMCPFCGNEDQGSLRYFFVEDDLPAGKNGFRVDVCDRCKSYIKTLDERKLPQSQKPDLYLENLNTLYLDALAQDDGYRSPTFWMMGSSDYLAA
jgi:FdhE protein